MSDLYFLLAAVAVLAILSLFRFIGCDLLFGLDEISQEPTYPQTVMKDAPVAYWRLQEPRDRKSVV